MPRAFLVLNKKTKSKHKKSVLEDEQGLLKDENQNVQQMDHQRDKDFPEVEKRNNDRDSEEDIEIDVEGTCPVHEELILPYHHRRDSVTSVSPVSSTSLQYHHTSEHNTCYTIPESRSSSSSITRTVRSCGTDHKPHEHVYKPRGKFN